MQKSQSLLLILWGTLLTFGIVLHGRRKKTTQDQARITSNLIHGILLAGGFSNTTAGYITAQSAFETNNFASPLIRRADNAFGMKQPEIRETTSSGTTLTGFARYRDIPASVQDYILWWNYNNMPARYDSLFDFVLTLKDKDYFAGRVNKYFQGVNLWYDHYFVTKDLFT